MTEKWKSIGTVEWVAPESNLGAREVRNGHVLKHFFSPDGVE